MSVHFRIAKTLLDEIRTDLRRRHAFAAERVGFAKARLGTADRSNKLVLVTGYEPVEDDRYIDDQESGARIDGDAIRRAMTIALQEDVGVFHVHLHDFPGVPELGRMDRLEIPHLVKTLRHTNPRRAHGILLLSENSLSTWSCLPGEVDLQASKKTVVVGVPMVFRELTHAE
jgi:hypothetical protein